MWATCCRWTAADSRQPGGTRTAEVRGRFHPSCPAARLGTWLRADDPIARYREALLGAGLGRYAAALLDAVRPSISLEPTVTADGEVPVGASKLGGRPDLPAGSAWPSAHGIPLAFVAQLDLREFSDLDVERVLPEAGLLSFFFEATWGISGNSPSCSWDVLLTPASAPLERLDFPPELHPYARYGAAALRGTREPTFVPWESAILRELGLGVEDVRAYSNAIESADRTVGTHRLLGHPDAFNGDLQLACPYLARGMEVGDRRYDERLHRAFAEEARRWRLLLQVDSWDEIGMDFALGGLLFFCVRDDDLAARRFHRAATDLQRQR